MPLFISLYRAIQSNIAVLTRDCTGGYSKHLFCITILITSRRDWKMANHKSAIKRVRQTERKNAVNSNNRARLRSELKKLRGVIAHGNATEAKALLPQTVSLIDKSI